MDNIERDLLRSITGIKITNANFERNYEPNVFQCIVGDVGFKRCVWFGNEFRAEDYPIHAIIPEKIYNNRSKYMYHRQLWPSLDYYCNIKGDVILAYGDPKVMLVIPTDWTPFSIDLGATGEWYITVKLWRDWKGYVRIGRTFKYRISQLVAETFDLPEKSLYEKIIWPESRGINRPELQSELNRARMYGGSERSIKMSEDALAEFEEIVKLRDQL